MRVKVGNNYKRDEQPELSETGLSIEQDRIAERLIKEEQEMSLMLAAAEPIPLGEVIEEWQVQNSPLLQYFLSNRLRLIREALLRLRTGTYGRCPECGIKIDRKRLAADLAVSRCLVCTSLTENGILQENS
jgi:RNA polymerase-binding transcription factor DksA